MTFATPIHTNEQSIDRVLQVKLPVMLVFWSRDCKPCKELDPLLNRLAIQFEGQALIAKINIEDNPELLKRYDVKALPGLVFVKDGQEIARGAGAAPEERLRAWLAYLAGRGERPPLPEGPSQPVAPTPEAGAGKPLVLTDATFEQTINGPLPVLVDFWAPWCGPCRMVAPSVEQLAREFAGRAVVAKLNVDENPVTARRYNVMSIPTLYVFKHGRPVDRVVGAQPLQALRQALMRHVG